MSMITVRLPDDPVRHLGSLISIDTASNVYQTSTGGICFFASGDLNVQEMRLVRENNLLHGMSVSLVAGKVALCAHFRLHLYPWTGNNLVREDCLHSTAMAAVLCLFNRTGDLL